MINAKGGRGGKNEPTFAVSRPERGGAFIRKKKKEKKSPLLVEPAQEKRGGFRSQEKRPETVRKQITTAPPKGRGHLFSPKKKRRGHLNVKPSTV